MYVELSKRFIALKRGEIESSESTTGPSAAKTDPAPIDSRPLSL